MAIGVVLSMLTKRCEQRGVKTVSGPTPGTKVGKAGLQSFKSPPGQRPVQARLHHEVEGVWTHMQLLLKRRWAARRSKSPSKQIAVCPYRPRVQRYCCQSAAKRPSQPSCARSYQSKKGLGGRTSAPPRRGHKTCRMLTRQRLAHEQRPAAASPAQART